MRIGVRTNLAQVRRDVRAFREDQVPFATSKALNELAKLFQRKQTDAILEDFTVRDRTFMRRAVKIKPFARKRSLFAQVQIEPPGGARTADILAKFERGGTKRPQGSRLAIPQEVRRTKTGKIRTNLRPSKLNLKSVSGQLSEGDQRTFSIRRSGGRGGIFQRVGRGARSKVRLLYAFIPRARIRPRLGFIKRAKSVAKEFGPLFDRAYRAALRTAK